MESKNIILAESLLGLLSTAIQRLEDSPKLCVNSVVDYIETALPGSDTLMLLIR